MPSPLQYPNINGFDFSWSSVEISIGGIKNVVQSKSLKYKDNRTIGKIFGTSVRKIGRTRGQLDPNGSWEVYRAAWDQIMAYGLPGAGLIGFGEIPVDIHVSYAEPSMPSYITSDVLRGCLLLSPEGGGSEGTDGLTVPFELDIMQIEWGKNLATGGMGFTQLSAAQGAIGLIPAVLNV
jgi:hypothetical protein